MGTSAVSYKTKKKGYIVLDKGELEELEIVETRRKQKQASNDLLRKVRNINRHTVRVCLFLPSMLVAPRLNQGQHMCW